MRLRNLATRLAGFALAAAAATTFAQSDPAQSSATAEAYRTTNVRNGPGVDYDVVGELREGTFTPITGRSDAYGNWLRIRMDNQDGWVAYFTVTVHGELDNVPIIEVLTPGISDDSNSSISIEIPISSDGPHSDVYGTAYRRANVRSGPGTDFPVFGALSPGQTVDIIGTSGDDNEWLQIDFFGEKGWVAYFTVSISGDVDELDIINPEALATEEPDADADLDEIVHNQVIVITRFNTNLRSEPHFGADVLAVVPYETTLQAVGRTDDSAWLQVNYEDMTGWLIASLVNSGVSDVASLPVIDLTIPVASPSIP